MEVSREAIEEPLRAVLEAAPADATGWTSLLTDLRRRLESPRMRAFRRFLTSSGGLKFLLDLRADVLGGQRKGEIDLAPLDEEIAHLFDSWFQYGFLFLQEITQESPYRQIRFLQQHDMVHPMSRLDEMGDRLGEDRRCFAIYHRAMPEEPVVFIEVALTRGLARSIHEILDGSGERSKNTPNTAVFYSINNTQNGLAGLGLGKVLILQVVDAIKQNHTAIKTFATLSPLPGLRDRYLLPILEGRDEPFALGKTEIVQYFPEKARERLIERYRERSGVEESDFGRALAAILSQSDWIEDELYRKELEKPLRSIAFFYLTREKDPRGKPLNSVANFHMGNGARLSPQNVHFGANRTERGLQDSCGVMVSYVYSSTWLEELRRTARSMLPWG